MEENISLWKTSLLMCSLNVWWQYYLCQKKGGSYMNMVLPADRCLGDMKCLSWAWNCLHNGNVYTTVMRSVIICLSLGVTERRTVCQLVLPWVLHVVTSPSQLPQRQAQRRWVQLQQGQEWWLHILVQESSCEQSDLCPQMAAHMHTHTSKDNPTNEQNITTYKSKTKNPETKRLLRTEIWGREKEKDTEKEKGAVTEIQRRAERQRCGGNTYCDDHPECIVGKEGGAE